MKKKLLILAIVGIFLVTYISTIPATEMELENKTTIEKETKNVEEETVKEISGWVRISGHIVMGDQGTCSGHPGLFFVRNVHIEGSTTNLKVWNSIFPDTYNNWVEIDIDFIIGINPYYTYGHGAGRAVRISGFASGVSIE
jgi:hypothetical protein